MIALISLLTIVILGITIVRVGATALELTGLSPDVASFQAQSAFSGTGFTTSESETIVSHPVRRKIVRFLILFGNAGITTTIATFILTFVGQDREIIITRAGALAGGLLCIFILTKSKILHNLLKKIVVDALKRSKALKLLDYQEVLGISKGYSISRVNVKKDNWMVGKHLKDLELHKEGTLVLSIHRKLGKKESFVVPSGDTVIKSSDWLTIYGKCANGECLSKRTKANGDKAHNIRCEQEKHSVQLQEQELLMENST